MVVAARRENQAKELRVYQGRVLLWFDAGIELELHNTFVVNVFRLQIQCESVVLAMKSIATHST
jgi:hypothetical protein